MKIKTTAGILAAFAVMTLGACPGSEDTPEDTPDIPPAKPTEPMATGGDGDADYVYSGGGVWDEVHIFTANGELNMTRASAAVKVLVVAGGGGGGTAYQAMPGGTIGGGGGAGGLIYQENYALDEGTHTVLVGAGGEIFYNGADSQFAGDSSLLAKGGGGGGRDVGENSTTLGKTGGSGGGSAWLETALNNGTTGQGNSGGVAAGDRSAGGGGGAGEAGAAATGWQIGGKGGDGLANSISGAEVCGTAGSR
jgi:hypothetical protein